MPTEKKPTYIMPVNGMPKPGGEGVTTDELKWLAEEGEGLRESDGYYRGHMCAKCAKHFRSLGYAKIHGVVTGHNIYG